jgi:RNA polymerase sigma-70 factor (ECF subfamily)
VGCVRFPSTFWTRIERETELARAEIFTQYRAPIYHFILARARSEHDADDLTQEVFKIVCTGDFLRKADREKGKFRSLLLGVTNWIHQGKERLKKHLLGLVHAYASSDAEYEEEIAFVKRHLK